MQHHVPAPEARDFLFAKRQSRQSKRDYEDAASVTSKKTSTWFKRRKTMTQTFCRLSSSNVTLRK